MFFPRLNNIFLITAVIFLTISFLACSSREPYSLVIKNGLIVNGTGKKPFVGDVAIRGDRVVKVGRLKDAKALETVDASGMVVAPGFIDVHTHADRRIGDVPTADNYLLQGVTTVIGGNCGSHPFPLSELFARLEKQGIAINFGCLVGHNTIREKVTGMKTEDPTPEEMAEMKRLIEEEMKAGGLGFSTGLTYLPGTYSKTEEIVELASVAARFGGVYASHLRDQGKKITEAIEEAIEVGRRNRMTVEISHIKLADEAVWNKLTLITKPVEKARKEGLKVFCDLYPYDATSSGFTSSFPSWSFEGGREKFLERLKDPAVYNQIKNHIIERRLTSPRGFNRLQAIIISRCRLHPEYEGKNLEEILEMKGIKPTAEAAADLIIEIEKEGGAQGIFFQMDDADVMKLYKLPYVMVGSDGEIQVYGQGSPHPRSYGTFPRVIFYYSGRKKLVSLEETIKKMTSLPARVFNLKDRGVLKPGKYADITVYDPNNYRDFADYRNPHQYPTGLLLVVVNGKVVYREGKIQSLFPGRVLKGKAATFRKKT